MTASNEPRTASSPFARPADCDYPGAPTVADGKCRCIVCARCSHHTGNGYTGHHTTFCNAARAQRPAHFCCPDDCELGGVEPRVSDEDRQAAIAAVLESRCIQGGVEFWQPNTMEAYKIVAALVSHGWGPKALVDPMKLGEFIDAANSGGVAVPWRALQDYLRECGIEVTDDDA